MKQSSEDQTTHSSQAVTNFNPFCEVEVSLQQLNVKKVAVLHGRCTQSGFLHAEIEWGNKSQIVLNAEVHLTAYLQPLRDESGRPLVVDLSQDEIGDSLPKVKGWILTNQRLPEPIAPFRSLQDLEEPLPFNDGIIVKKSPIAPL